VTADTGRFSYLPADDRIADTAFVSEPRVDAETPPSR
jgi:hypothetical protein